MPSPSDREAHRQLQLDLNQQNREQWIDRVRREARRIATEQGTVCSDDLWPVVGDPPRGVDRRAIAGAFQGMRWVGFKKSSRKVCHHREISVFAI